MSNDEKIPRISIVVIGRNEQKNLDGCFTAVKNIDYPAHQTELIYVDCDSQDKSVEIAKKYTDKIFIEKSILPTAALARNRGIKEAQHELIHFIDGDAEIDKDYLREAVQLLGANNIAAVTGAVKEKHGHINKVVASYRQGRKEGYVDFLDNGGTFIKDVLIELNGYDERISRGEETELAARMAEKGCKIYYMEKLMVTHDFDLTWSGYCLRYYNTGKSLACISLLTPRNAYLVKMIRLGISNIVQNIIGVLVIILAMHAKSTRIIIWFISALLIAFFLKYIVMEKAKDKLSLTYAFLMNMFKPIAFLGQLDFYLRYMFSSTLRKHIAHKEVIQQ